MKRIISLLLAGALCLSLAACGAAPAPAAGEPDTAPSTANELFQEEQNHP